ncbi:TadE/TadG family type IV pilus assembly protein [Propionibacterium cyclohexanicum]|nr:TadE/TadG family type IV pilus assembly protein [Propionibacterium cyclohexanicum]
MRRTPADRSHRGGAAGGGTAGGGAAGTRACRGNERGAASTELVVIVPGLVLLIALMTAGWRIWSVRTQVQDAAAAGARAASLADSGARARSVAQEVIGADLATSASMCTQPQIAVDTSGFLLAPGVQADVRVDIGCTIALADLLIAVPGTIRAEGHATTRIDTFRQRRP